MAKQYGLNEAVDFAAANLVSFGGSFTRLNGQPIDKSQLWYPIWETIEGTEEKTYKTGLERARAYAATNAAFVGQELAVILPEYSAYADTDKTIPADGATVIGTSVTFYGIQNAAGDLKELGSKPLGDNASIAVSEDGTVTIYGFADAGEETLPQKQKDGTIKWVAISAIVQGDGNSVTTLSAADNSVLVEDEAEEGFEGHKYKVQVKRSQAENNAIELKEDGLFAADYSVTMQVREDESGDDHTAFKHYVFSQLGKEIGHVDVPADLVVQSGKVEVKTAAGAWGDAGTYIVLTLANATSDKLYINVGNLIEYVTSGSTTDSQVIVSIDENHKVTATIGAGKIGATELAQTVKEDITKGTTAHGWGNHANAGYLKSGDISGKADKKAPATAGNLASLDASGNLEDSGKKVGDFATANQGTKADNALQEVEVGDGLKVSEKAGNKQTIEIDTDFVFVINCNF